jgi:hypothetical protein
MPADADGRHAERYRYLRRCDVLRSDHTGVPIGSRHQQPCQCQSRSCSSHGSHATPSPCPHLSRSLEHVRVSFRRLSPAPPLTRYLLQRFPHPKPQRRGTRRLNDIPGRDPDAAAAVSFSNMQEEHFDLFVQLIAAGLGEYPYDETQRETNEQNIMKM